VQPPASAAGRQPGYGNACGGGELMNLWGLCVSAQAPDGRTLTALVVGACPGVTLLNGQALCMDPG